MTATFNARRARTSFCNRFFVRIGLGMSLALLAATTYAADRLALVIGNDAYKNVDALRNARNDAKLMATTLREAKFDVTAVENLDRTRLWAEIDRFKNRIKKGDEVVFYFAGHGVQIGSNQLLLPIDITAQNDRQVERDGVPLIDIQEALKDARTAVFVIDACRENPFPKQGTRSIGGTRGLIPPDVTSGQIVILSAGRNQKALDNVPGQISQNGLFTHELVQVIKSGNPEVRTAFEQVKQRVDDKAKRNGHEQRPSVVSDLNGNFYFFIGPGSTVIVNPTLEPQRPVTRIQSVDEIEQQAWEDAERTNTVAALEAYLAEYPKGRFASRARIRVASLAPTSGSTATARLSQFVSADPLAELMRPSLPRSGEVFKDCSDCPELVVIPGGEFTMGSNDSDDEKPPHGVRIKSFALGKTEVTQGQWKAVMGSNPSRFKDCGDMCPVESVSWNDAQEYLKKLSAQTGKTYRLPSEAEWEYAVRGGTTTKWSHGDAEGALGDYAWFNANSVGKTQRVGQKRANPYGLSDMHGNVSEWVEDCVHGNYLGAPADGRAWTTSCASSERAHRGGPFGGNPALLRSANRNWFAPDFRNPEIGFRIARTF